MMRGLTQSRGLALVTRSERVEAALWRRLRSDGAVTCRERLFTMYQRLARSIARRYCRSTGLAPAMLPDLEQAAYQGLLQAIDHFDPNRNVPFAAFARLRVAGSVRDSVAHLTELGAQIDFRRRRDNDRLRSIAADATRPSAQSAAIDQLADVAVELALALMLDLQVHRGDDLRGDHDNAFDSLAWRQLVGKLTWAIAELPDDEKLVIRQHYDNDILFAEIATMLGLTKGRISQIHKSALQRLSKKLRVRR
mgnify:CR=1 FL=1